MTLRSHVFCVMHDELTLSELCEAAGVSQRTVRYYMKRGLLPAASRSGPGVRYPAPFLWRLELILRLKQEDLPLARIRERLEALSDDEVQRLLRGPVEPAPGSAAEYIRAVLAERGPSREARRRRRSSRGSRPAPGEVVSDRWERIRITPDVEIHVRRPLSRSMNSRVQQLVEAAIALLH